MDNFRVTVSWSDLRGSFPTYDDVVARLRPYGLEVVLATLGAISSRISMPWDQDVIEAQRELISRVFDDPGQLGNDIEAWRAVNADSEFRSLPIVFHELQVVTVTKIALLEVPPASANGPHTLQAFGEALLMVNDLIGVYTKSHELTPRVGERADLLRWVRYVVPNRLFHNGGNFKHAIARAHDLYLTDRQHLRGEADYLDLPALFERITDVAPALASVAMFGALERTETDDPKVLLKVDTFLEALNLHPDEERAVFALFSERADVLREELMSGGCGVDDLRIFDPLPLGDTPVVVHDGRAYCPSVAFLHRRMTRGLFHFFLAGLRDRRESGRFLRYMGRVFEDYIDSLLCRVFPRGSGRYLGPECLNDPALLGSKKCDAVIVYEDSVVLIEAKATLMHLPVWRDGDIEALSGKVDDIFGDAATQFAGTIRLIEEGHLKGKGVDPSRIESYLPLVVTLETMPNDFMVYRLVEQRMRRQVALQDPKAKPVQWADVGDAESLEALLTGGNSLHDILMARLEDGSYREESLGNWLIGQYGPVALGANAYLEQRFDKIAAQALAEFRVRRRAD